ncbi:hypothetical protein KJ940_02825, partial [Myxococcota bacterium]|nr:hypothetical protein [Myxococcota bacterium]
GGGGGSPAGGGGGAPVGGSGGSGLIGGTGLIGGSGNTSGEGESDPAKWEDGEASLCSLTQRGGPASLLALLPLLALVTRRRPDAR